MPSPRGLVSSVLLLACAALSLDCERPPSLPNIVLVIGDDHGWNDFGFMGSPVARTPNLDELAREGVVFTHAFNTSSVCRPSLQTLLTGLHPVQIEARLERLRNAGRQIRTFEEVEHFETLPARLGERGYVSFQGGKYWDGTYADGGFSHGMTRRVGGASGYRFPLAFSGADGLTLGRETLEPLWSFVDEHSHQPFFVWFAPMLPHTPHDAAARYLELYEGMGLSPIAQRYYANVSRFDDVVGRVVAGLEARGLQPGVEVATQRRVSSGSSPSCPGGPGGRHRRAQGGTHETAYLHPGDDLSRSPLGARRV